MLELGRSWCPNIVKQDSTATKPIQSNAGFTIGNQKTYNAIVIINHLKTLLL